MPEALSADPGYAASYAESLFTPDALRAPFAHYHAIRELGPAVWLASDNVYAIGRFADVRSVLRAADIWISGEGVGFNARFNAPAEYPPVIRRDGESHKRLRRVLVRPLMPAALKTHRAMLKALISERIAALVGQGEFDAIRDVAQHLPLEAVAHLVGLGDADRSRMLEWAAASFNAIGPLALDGSDDPALLADLEQQVEVRRHLLGIDPATIRPGSWAAGLFDAVEDGELTLGDARAALAGLVLPSLDTTINAKGNLLHAIATHPDQWQALKRDPALIPAAVQEGMRFSPVVRWFSRVAARDTDIDGVPLAAGARAMLLYGAANRDERHYSQPHRFDIARNPTDQLGWGTGPHMCAGAALARIEMEVMLEALVEQVTTLHTGAHRYGANRGLYGFETLKLRLA